jgi:hypothetical protein
MVMAITYPPEMLPIAGPDDDAEVIVMGGIQECEHRPKKAALDSSVWCTRCAAYLGVAN